RRQGRAVPQSGMLYLGEINDSQRLAWERSIAIFDESRGEQRQMALFPSDRTPPLEGAQAVQVHPGLTGEQKRQILAWLAEAREHAMDAGSSEAKHAWFGKYKGKINNYLAAAGYDAKKAEKTWLERRKAQARNNTSSP
ncbi:MAG: DUF3826 domain-containing protein, partial [Opitutaceae bacterium]